MSRRAGAATRRRWFAPEVVQTSAMDCGPAALKCLLEGFYVPVSFGRLREACQTDVDGTSIDTIEVVANQLGLHAEQEMLPLDHLLLRSAATLPALVVVRRSDGSTHFVVAWRRVGDRLQVMDPSIGQRWIRCDRLLDEVFIHETSVPAEDWRGWAASEEARAMLRERLRRLGAGGAAAADLVGKAQANAKWFGFGALDAAIRLVTLMLEAGGVKPGREAVRLVAALFAETCASPGDIFKAVPHEYWSVVPDPTSGDDGRPHLLLRGAVLLRVPARRAAEPRGAEVESDEAEPRLSPELVAALSEQQTRPLRLLWDMFRADGILGPLVLIGAMTFAAGATLIEALLFRGLFDVGGLLNLTSQRLVAALGVLAFAALMLAFRVPIVAESLRLGRHLDAKLRMALLRKLPHLSDRYFQSRPISDMADRSHGIYLTRLVPGIGIHFMQSLFELTLTLIGIVLIDPPSTAPAVALAVVTLAVPAALQPTVNERDLRVRNHAGALGGFYLDTLLGLMPVRAHCAEAAVRRQHEALLVQWLRSSRRLFRFSILADALQAIGCVGIAAYLLVQHFRASAGVTGGDLLLIYWTLKLPAVANTLINLAHQYPMQRNVLLRLMEPLTAPEDVPAAAVQPVAVQPAAGPLGFAIEDGHVLAAGRTILRDVNLAVAPGEHVAIVGRSGAGKSSLLGILLGWHRLADGRLSIDGAEPTAEAAIALRRQIAWVDPAIQIWNKSFLANLTYSARDPDFARTAAAIEAADLRGVLKKLPSGLQTELGEGGALLSGGEGQRVRFGRALAQSDVRLALFDEPFRGVDRARRSELLARTRREWQGTTLLCVTHDVGETLSFDRVLVMEDGRILEDGAPRSLAERPTRYRELLQAEQAVRERMWAGAHWRRLHLQRGRVGADAS